MRKLIPILALGLLSSVMPAQSEALSLGPPYEKEFEILQCGEGTFSTCTADGRFEPADGTIDLTMRVAASETPGAGRGYAIGLAWFTVEDQLETPSDSLAYEVDIRIDDAHATVDGLYANNLGVPAKGFAFAEASFVASSEGCGCPGSTGNIRFVSTRHAGSPSALQNTTITLRATLEPEEGELIPVGPVRVVFLFHARAELGWTVAPSVPVPDTGEASLGFQGQLIDIRRVA